jgi:hypothetical protein
MFCSFTKGCDTFFSLLYLIILARRIIMSRTSAPQYLGSIYQVAFLSLILLGLAGSAKAQAPEITASYLPQGDSVRIIWAVNFKPDNYSLTGRTKKETMSSEFPIVVAKEKIKVSVDDPVNSKKWTLITDIPYGPDQNLSDQTEYAYLTIGTSSGSSDAPTQSARADITLNLEAIRQYRDLLAESKTCVQTTPASLSEKSVIWISDRSLTVHLIATQTITVNVLAFENPSTTPKKGDSTPFRKDNQLLVAFTPKDVKIPDLRSGKESGKTYIVVIEEVTSANNPPGRTLLWEQITQDNQGKTISTLPEIKRPSVRIMGHPQTKRNETVYVEVSAENATSVTAYVITRDKNGTPIKLSDEVNIPPKSGMVPVDKTAYAGEISVALDEGSRQYQVVARAVTSMTDDDNSAENTSDPFISVPRKLFSYVSYEINDQQMKFTLEDATSPLKTSVAIKLNDKALIARCSKDGTSCEFDLGSVFGALAKKANNPAGGTAPASSNKILFEVSAQATDGTDRRQGSSFALSIKAPDASDASASSKFKGVTDFATSLVTGTGNPKLEANKVKGTGLGGFLGSLLRGFLRVP